MSRTLVPADVRIAALEDQVRLLENAVRQLTQRLARGGDPRNPRLARTTHTGENYPTRADAYNTWEIVFVDGTFTAELGIQSLTLTNRQSENFAVAHNLYNDPFVPENTLLMVWWDNGRWWFDYSDEIQVGILQGSLTAGGSASVKAQLNGSDQPGGAVQVYDKLGVMSGSSPMKCYFKWQREHAQYWFVNMECDDELGSSFPVVQPAVVELFQPPRDRERRGLSDFATQFLG